MPEQLESVLYGTKSFDLSTDRAVRDDFELIRFPTARALTPLNVPDECYLHFGDKDNPGLDLRDYIGQQFNVLGRKTIGAVYLENPTGATGTLELFYGTEVGVEANPEIGELSTITSTVTVTDDGSFNVAGTVDVGDRSGREVGKARLENSSGVLIDPAESLDGATSKAVVTDTSNATITAGNGRTAVTVAGEASGGAMTVTVEVSDDGTNWYERTDIFAADIANGDSEAESFTTGMEHVRASGDANVGRLVVSSKGA